MNIAVEAHRSRLSRLTTYVASAKLLSNLAWKAVKTKYVLVDDVSVDPVMEPLELVVVGQVSHGVSHLDVLGNFSAQFDNMARAKFAFELELPSNPAFTADYYKAVATLRRLQRDAAKTTDIRHLLVDASTSSNIKFSAPLFRRKLDGQDTELLPEGLIADEPDDPDYFPTASNWPVPFGMTHPFKDTLDTHVFQPLHVFTAAGKRIAPDLFARRLPGALVEVHFSLHHWYFARDRFDSFNAHARQIVIIKDPASMDSSRVKRKAVRGIHRQGDEDSGHKRERNDGPMLGQSQPLTNGGDNVNPAGALSDGGSSTVTSMNAQQSRAPSLKDESPKTEAEPAKGDTPSSKPVVSTKGKGVTRG